MTPPAQETLSRHPCALPTRQPGRRSGQRPGSLPSRPPETAPGQGSALREHGSPQPGRGPSPPRWHRRRQRPSAEPRSVPQRASPQQGRQSERRRGLTSAQQPARARPHLRWRNVWRRHGGTGQRAPYRWRDRADGQPHPRGERRRDHPKRTCPPGGSRHDRRRQHHCGPPRRSRQWRHRLRSSATGIRGLRRPADGCAAREPPPRRERESLRTQRWGQKQRWERTRRW